MTPLLRTLGTLSLLRHAGPGAPILDMQPKRLALLVFLARTSRSAPVRRDVLLAQFWPESDEQHARAVLRQALSAFRKQLGSDAILTSGEEEVAIASGALACDANDVEDEYQRGNHETACRLFAGEFLQGFHATDVAPEFEQWVDTERARLRRMAGDSARRVARAFEQEGQAALALRYAWRSVEIEPDSEAGVAHLIAVLDAQGDRTGALSVYRDLERRLADEFAAEPSPETRALIRAIRARPTPAVSIQPRIIEHTPAHTPDSAGTTVPHAPRPAWQRRMGFAAVAAAVATVAVALMASSAKSRTAPEGQRELLAVTPFRLHSSDSSLHWLAEGIPELLTDRLSATLPSRIVPPEQSFPAWRRIADADSHLDPARLGELGRAVGASRVVQGSVSGTPSELVLTAFMTSVTGALPEERATSRGPLDSLAPMIEHLARQLLAQAAGLDAQQVGSLAGVPSSALMPFLTGRVQLRQGRALVALRYFNEALAADSTFALAALEILRIAAWPALEVDERPANRIAQEHRARLTPADQVLLDVVGGDWVSAPERLRSLNAGVKTFPWRAEMWYYLGDGWLHFGRLAGYPDALARAEDAFRRGWTLDSAANGEVPLTNPLLAEPALHLVELAHIRADTAEVLRLAAMIRKSDSTSDLAAAAGWHGAAMRGVEAREAWWGRRRDLSQLTTKNIVLFISNTGLAGEDLPRAWEEDRRRLLSYDPGFRGWAIFMTALNAGRPGDLPSNADYPLPPQIQWQRDLRAAQWWGLDSAAGAHAARELSRIADGPPLTGEAGVEQDRAACAVATLRARRGDAATAAQAAARLRDDRVSGLSGVDSAAHVAFRRVCATLIDAQNAVWLRHANALALVDHADSLARTDVGGVWYGRGRMADANLILARLWESLGQPDRALAAVRRRTAAFLRGPHYMSPYLKEEGRLAAAAGDTAGAIRAWRHYLTLRPNPEPVAAAEVDSIRRALATLVTR